MRVYCDFDGTITRSDTTDEVLSQLAGGAWIDLENDWIAGRITAAQCMRGQIALVPDDGAALDAVLDAMVIRDGFIEMALWCRDNRIPLTVVSDGVDRFISRILARHGLDFLPVFANRLATDGAFFALEQPFLRAGCAAGSGVCKCDILERSTPADTTVFVGDGRSDFCVSARADLLFARDKLADYARSRGQAFTPFDDFFDVLAGLKACRAGRCTA